jgi:outer membrane protein insertion porin family
MTVALLLLALILPGQNTQIGDSNKIEDVQIRGNRRIPTDSIKYNVLTKAGDAVNTDTIRRDVKALYALGYFEDIRVDEEDGARGKIIIFVVKEKPLIRSIAFEGANSITKSEILDKLKEKKVGLSQESPYDPLRVRRTEGIIQGMLAEKGRRNAKIDVTTESVPPNGIALTFKIDEGPKTKIEKIDIQGNEVFSDRQIKQAMKLVKEATPFTVFTGKDTYYDLKLADDITRIRMLYAAHGYVRANILEPVVETRQRTAYRTLPLIRPPFPWGIPIPYWPKQVDRDYITIKIEENSQYRLGDIRIVGNEEFKSDLIKAVLGLASGRIYNEEQLRKGFENLKKLYGSRGYVNFTPVPTQDFDEARKLVNLTINIDEDRQFRVNRISFTGNTTTRDKVIRREIMVDEGQIFNSSLWDLSLLRLNQLGYFEEVKSEDAEIKPNPANNTVDINLKVKEKGRNSIGFNGGVSGVGGGFLGLNYSTNNFIGLGETFSITLQGGTRQSQYQIGFTEPYLFNRPLTTGFSVFSTSYRYDQARDVFGLDPSKLPAGLGFENRLNFEQKHTGFNTSISYPVRVFHRIGVNFQFDDSTTSAVNPATEEFFKGVLAEEQQTLPGTTASVTSYHARRLTTSYAFNSTNNPYNPTTGHSFTGSLEFTGGLFGGNVDFYRPTLEFRYFKPVNGGRNTLAIRAMASHVQSFTNSSVPFYERFFLGGDFDIRGFDFRSISPIAFITRTLDVTDAAGKVNKKPYDDIVYVGGDTQGIFNFEYRIPLAGPITLAAFADAGNTWVSNKRALQRQVVDADGHLRQEKVQFLPGTNASVRVSTGAELQVVMPVINAPFRIVFAVNPRRLDHVYTGPTTGAPLTIREPAHDIRFTVGRTF